MEQDGKVNPRSEVQVCACEYYIESPQRKKISVKLKIYYFDNAKN